MIWPSMKFNFNLQNFKKPLVDIFSPQIERKKRSEESLVIILAVERKLWAIFLPRVWKKFENLWKQ